MVTVHCSYGVEQYSKTRICKSIFEWFAPTIRKPDHLTTNLLLTITNLDLAVFPMVKKRLAGKCSAFEWDRMGFALKNNFTEIIIAK